MGSETGASCRDQVILVDETAESVPAPNAGSSRNRRMSTSDLDTPGRPEREASVRPLVVVVPHIFVEDTFEVASTPEQRPVQALLPHGSYPPLRDRVGVRRLDRRRDGPDAVGSEDIVERAGELAVAVTNQEPRCPARVQGVVATLPCWIKNRWSLRASAGVLQPRVLRGRLLRAAATAARSPAVCLLRSVPLGKYCRSPARCRSATARAGPSRRPGPRSGNGAAGRATWAPRRCPGSGHGPPGSCRAAPGRRGGAGRAALPGCPAVVGRGWDLQDPQDGLDPEPVTMLCDEPHDRRRVGSVEVGPRRGSGLVTGPFPRAASRTRRAPFNAPGSPQARWGCVLVPVRRPAAKATG